MNQTQLAALLAFIGGAAAAMTTSALVREAPGAKSYYTHHLEIDQRPAADGGNDITAVAFVTATVALTDGGTAVADLGGNSCAELISGLTPTQRTNLQNILTGSANCGKNAP